MISAHNFTIYLSYRIEFFGGIYEALDFRKKIFAVLSGILSDFFIDSDCRCAFGKLAYESSI